MAIKTYYLFAIALGVAALGSVHAAESGHLIANNTPRFVTAAKNLGPANPAQIIDVVVWLKPHNRGEIDTLAEDLYDPNSSNYHDWLKPADVLTKFAPTAKEAQMVGEFLSAHNLPVVAIGRITFRYGRGGH